MAPEGNDSIAIPDIALPGELDERFAVDAMLPRNLTFEELVGIELDNLKSILLAKNKKYGNSALEPVRVFSKASPIEQLLVRIDDKLSRMANQQPGEDEDVTMDLMGYLVLLRIAEREL